MNRIAHRSTAFVFAAITTIGVFEGIALLFAVPAPLEPMVVALPGITVTASAPQAPVQSAWPGR